jgi:hypothetical protein
MRVTALIENTRLKDRDDLQPEFGLSLDVEVNGTRVLFDMGASAEFASNAAALGIAAAFNHADQPHRAIAMRMRAARRLRVQPVFHTVAARTSTGALPRCLRFLLLSFGIRIGHGSATPK